MIFSTPVAKDVGVITSQITELRKFPCEAIFLAINAKIISMEIDITEMRNSQQKFCQ